MTDALGAGSAVQIGQKWRAKPPGREVVRVERVWACGPETLVRAHPVRGGRPMVCSVEHLRTAYALEATDD